MTLQQDMMSMGTDYFKKIKLSKPQFKFQEKMNTRLNMWSEMYLDMIKIEMVAYHINNLYIFIVIQTNFSVEQHFG